MKEFDKQFSSMEKGIWVMIVCSGILSIGGLVFFGWVIIKLLQHFGVI